MVVFWFFFQNPRAARLPTAEDFVCLWLGTLVFLAIDNKLLTFVAINC